MTAPNQNVAEFLLQGRDPARPALLLPRGQHNYGELHAGARAVAAYLAARGARKGDRVLLLSENSLFWVSAYLGILLAGLACVPLPPSMTDAELEFILDSTGARIACITAALSGGAALCLRGFHLLTSRAMAPVPLAASQTDFSVLEAVPDLPSPGTAPDDLAALMFTSGSTGKPRGVMVTHRNIVANTGAIVQYLGLTARDRMMTVLPFHYCFGTSLLHTHLSVGGSLVLDSRFLYPEVILQRMIETECTGFAGVPSHFQILLRNSSLPRKRFPRLRHVQQAGGSLPPQFIRGLRLALPDTRVFVMYGQTEATARLSYLPPEYLDTKLGSVGKGIPGVRLQVLNEADRPVAPGEVGEIVAEGENIARGYWEAPGETAAAFRHGRLYTGDLATVDEDGFIFIVDRSKDFLKCGGKRVSSRDIENRLLEFDSLLEAAVVGMPDDVLGEAVKAYVVLRDPGDPTFEERFRAFCRERLPSVLCPRQTIVVSWLPKNSAGKVLKRELQSGAPAPHASGALPSALS